MDILNVKLNLEKAFNFCIIKLVLAVDPLESHITSIIISQIKQF